MQRNAGILLPISSLPSKYGIGCFSQCAYDFVDWLHDAGQTYWQILPICPTSYGDSPYQSFSTYAGNPYFISLEALIEEGVLTQEECDAADFGSNPADVDYAALCNNRYPLLRKAYERSDISKNPDYQAFLAENHWWLNDYALFMALKNFFCGQSWSTWPEDIRLRWDFALDHYRRVLYFDIEFQMYLQFKFFQQYRALKKYANSRGIKIVGDIPIYVAMDSADTWANPQLFQLDETNTPTAVAGCPPDGFAATGQLWGNPLYRWDYHKETGFQWWTTRLWYCYQLYDVTRIDHFRGFDEYYAIPYGEPTAVNGKWMPGPGMDLFNALEENLGKHEVIAEDLGYMTDTVRELVKDSGFPNMKVLEFAFDARDTGSASDYLPHNYSENCVAYTGTHDNETLVSWLDNISRAEVKMVRSYLCDHHTPKKQLYKSLIALVLRSPAKDCIIPAQDYLGLDNSARMNFPSTIGTNWRWRLTPGQLDEEMREFVFDMTRRYGRLNPILKKEEEERIAAEEAAKKAAEEAENEAKEAETTEEA
ncbi:MAG: 4-alpha-glucanotransferase [Clostridia bacterium]|nr:4-alpha-glucanotransferase [Clostridia bacterium]